MAEADFFTAESRGRASDTVRAVELQTAAELLVQVRRFSGRYRDADYLAGAVLALTTLVVLLYAPRHFPLIGFPVQTALAFAAGAFLSSKVAVVRRLFTTKKRRTFEVHRAARAAFHELGVARCSGRWGIFILVSTFERRVEVLTDIGIDVAALGDAWPSAHRAMEDAVARYDYAAFLAAVGTLGPLLATQHPHRADDVDELPNDLAAEPAGDGDE